MTRSGAQKQRDRAAGAETGGPAVREPAGDPAEQAEAAEVPARGAAEAPALEATEAGAEAPEEAAPEPTEIDRGHWRLYVSRDRNTAFLDYRPLDGEPPSASELLDAARELGVPEEGLFVERKLAKVVANTHQSAIALKGYAISEDKDASFTIDVDDERMRATLTIIKGRGLGEALDLKELGGAIRRSGLKGMDLPQIKIDVLEFYRSPASELVDYELAVGTRPDPGEPPSLTWQIPFLLDEATEELRRAAREAPQQVLADLDSAAEVPVGAIEQMAPVKKDHIVAEVVKKSSGSEGLDVYGRVVQLITKEVDILKTFEYVHRDGVAYVAEREGVLELWHIDRMPCIRVRPHRDAAVDVRLSADAMLASVRLREGEGTGCRLTPELVRQALIDAEVIRGIDMDAVDVAVDGARELGRAEDVVVARGQPPEEAGEDRLSFRVDMASGSVVSIRDDGRADFKTQDRITTVQADELIAEILMPESKPADGWDVKSRPVKAKGAGSLKLEVGDNVRQEDGANGRKLLYAEISGELVYEANRIEVRNVYTVKGDVGLATGNIKFPGSVHVTGGVSTGFYIMSRRSVKIAESVEGALVSAEESVFIKHGVKGQGKAIIRARAGITAAFAEQATLMSNGNITIKNACLRCTVKSNARIRLTSDRGRLVGGRARARDGIEVAELGSSSAANTLVSFGQDYLIGDRIELEEKEIEKARAELVDIDLKVRAAEKAGDRKTVQEKRVAKIRALKLIEKRSERLFWLRERFEQHYDSSVVVRGSVYPGVVLESHGRTCEITVEKKSVKFVFNQESGHIEELPLEADERVKPRDEHEGRE